MQNPCGTRAQTVLLVEVRGADGYGRRFLIFVANEIDGDAVTVREGNAVRVHSLGCLDGLRLAHHGDWEPGGFVQHVLQSADKRGHGFSGGFGRNMEKKHWHGRLL